MSARLAAATALILDLRGYSRGRPSLLNRLSGEEVRSARFEAGISPAGRGRGDLQRRRVNTRAGGLALLNTVFITNGSAISYAESVLGLVAANRLAEIIGEPTAGANGNVATFTVPGGYQLRWTAMRVTNRDGSQHYLRGVQPTIPLRRTIAGIRAGRDELLDRALAEVRRGMAEESSE